MMKGDKLVIGDPPVPPPGKTVQILSVAADNFYQTETLPGQTIRLSVLQSMGFLSANPIAEFS